MLRTGTSEDGPNDAAAIPDEVADPSDAPHGIM